MAQPTHRIAGRRGRITGLLLAGAAGAIPGMAYAQCTPATPGNGATVTCSGSSGTYSSASSSLTVNVASSASVTAPLVISGAGGTLNNAGTIGGTGAFASVSFGDNATINNGTAGTISASGTTTGAAAISVGVNSTVTNDGTITASSAFPAVAFGTATSLNYGGTFINNADAPVAVTGNIVYGINVGNVRASFQNNNTSFGLTGSVIATGNIDVHNEGLWTGNFSQIQTSQGTTVTFDNGSTNPATATASGATFTGVIATGDATTATNAGTMVLYAGSAIGAYGTGASTFTNASTGILTIGTNTSPALIAVSGNFTSSGTLNITVSPAGVAAAAAGVSYSQVYAQSGAGANAALGGVANLSGKLNLVVQAGFYPTGSLYDVVLADKTINVSGLTISGNTLPFVTFASNGVVTNAAGKQAYEFTAQHVADYAAALRAAGIANTGNRADNNILAVAGGLKPLVPLANATPSGAEGTFLGYLDVLQNGTDPTQVQTAFASMSPEGYYAYVTALHDQARSFSRAIDLRIQDQNSNHDEDGWWLTGRTQFQINGVSDTFHTKSNIYGFSGGYDFSGPHHVLGVAASASWDSLKYGLGTMNGTNRDFALAAYGGMNFGPLHVTGSAAYHFGHLSATKTMTLGAYAFSNTAKSGEHLIDVNAKAGFQLKARGILIEPFVGIDYMNGKVKGFTETSSLLASELTVAALNANRTDLVAGAEITRSRGVFRPYARLQWRDRVSGEGVNNTVTASFDGQAATPFTVTAVTADRREIDTDAGINWVFDDAGSLFIGYQGTIRSHYQSHGINFGIRIEF